MGRNDLHRAYELLFVLGRVMDVALLVGISFFLMAKALVLRRRGELGLRLAQSNVALAIAFFGVLLAMRLVFFGTELWRDTIRLVLFVTLGLAVRAAVESFGGWRASGQEVGIMLHEWWMAFREASRPRQLAIVCAVVLFLAMVIAAQVAPLP
jgi:hypothetical protein